MVPYRHDQREPRSCTHCGATPEPTGTGSPLLRHATDCLNAHALDRISRADAAWFRDHPHADEYRRPLSWAERGELEAAGMPTHDADRTDVVVHQVRPGFRLRAFVTRAVAR